ncbi:glycosyl hydrolase [Flagelloscypha sp. PMI_526]|nr:glycosyl hydrolase [Flagelloscypha sp. PMI_526]
MILTYFLICLNLASVWCSPLKPKPKPQPLSKDGYGFIYFTGESLANGEEIYFAVSEENSPKTWTAVNGGNPVLNSTLGTLGLRDPYIIRDPNSCKFYIIATDLKMYKSTGGWNEAIRHGSLSLAIWETEDLVNFSEQRLVQVSPAIAGMTWAPEASWDRENNQFIVYWASSLYDEADTNHTGTSYPRIMYSNTTDFKTFSPAQIWIDRGIDAIDTSVAYVEETGVYYRFTATESAILQEKSTSLFGPWIEVTRGIGHDQFGTVEGPLLFEDNLESGLWHLFVDDVSPHGYQPFETTDIDSGVWTFSEGYTLPTNPRHGTVFAISDEEKANLLSIST